MINKIRVKKESIWYTPRKVFQKINGIWKEFRQIYTKFDDQWYLVYKLPDENFEFKDGLLWTENFYKFLLSEHDEPIVLEINSDKSNEIDKYIDQLVSFGGNLILTEHENEEDIFEYLENEEDDSPLLVETDTPEDKLIEFQVIFVKNVIFTQSKTMLTTQEGNILEY